MGRPLPNNFRRTKLTPTNYISLEREFIEESDSFSISKKYFDLATLWAIFAKCSAKAPEKTCDFMNTLRNFAKSVFAHISAKLRYFAIQFILFIQFIFTESPDHVL